MSRYAHALRSFLRWLALVGSLASGLAFVACDDDKGTRVCANETCTCGERRELSMALKRRVNLAAKRGKHCTDDRAPRRGAVERNFDRLPSLRAKRSW